MSRRSGRAKQVQRETSKTPEVEQSPDLDEQDEVTRCICGNDEITSTNPALSQLLSSEYDIKIDPGLFIQCEKCSVWQHGYCVGLFIDNDVPDKYWCEMCKPALHMFITDEIDQSSRTLYRPVNDERDRLIQYSTESGSVAEKSASEDTVEKADKPEKSEKSEKPEKLEKPEKSTRQRGRRSPNASGADSHSGSKDSDPPSTQTSAYRSSRKERRHAEETFDEQLQRALRESAASNETKREADSDQVERGRNGSKRTHSEELENEVNESNAEEETDTKNAKRDMRVKLKQRVSKKARASDLKASTPSTKNDEERSVPSKEELLSQPSKPRFVNEKSTIYELRKRTGAILEWLGRSQMELEEERDVKTLQFKEANVEGANLLSSVEDNSKLMENLTEKILAWEQRFGKYAP